jgi:hypothetical protein
VVAGLTGVAGGGGPVAVTPLRFRAVVIGDSDLAEENNVPNGAFEDFLPSMWRVRVGSSQPCPCADEMVPAQRHEKGIRQSTEGTTTYSAPMKVCSAGTNCMIKKKTAWPSGMGQTLRGNNSMIGYVRGRIIDWIPARKRTFMAPKLFPRIMFIFQRRNICLPMKQVQTKAQVPMVTT